MPLSSKRFAEPTGWPDGFNEHGQVIGRRIGRGRSGAAKREAIREQIAEESRFKQRATMRIGTVTMLRDNGITINDNP
jgi:metal-responsive CopG/Arc/MetJ family transcriptional regulator